ncbi:hypothetical protein ACXJJ3_30655 [Kribbella sp. WER1]
MTQPTESPQRANWGEALDRIGSLSPESWENLAAIAQLQKSEVDRLIQRAQHVPLKDKLSQKVETITVRVHALYTQQAERLSQSALATKGRALGNSALDTGSELAQGAVGLLEAGRDKAREAGRGAVAFGRDMKEETKLLGRDLKDMGTDIRDGVKQIPGDLKTAGKNLRDKVTRWLKTQKTRVTIASEGARATLAAMKFDKDMPQATAKDATQLSQNFSQVQATAPENIRLQAAQAIQSGAQARMAAHAAGAVAPAGQATGGQGQTTPQAQQPTEQHHGQQKNPDKGIGKG